jgi:hypothetical protein
MLSSDAVSLFFAFTPWVLFVAIVVDVYVATRGEKHAPATMGKTFACAQCGRRGKHEHMVPVSREGVVVWYCGRCAH